MHDQHKTLPTARVQKKRVTIPAVWIVPLAAALVAGYLVFDRVRQYGPTITISFADGAGLRTGQTRILYRGVQVGEVSSVGLTEDGSRVIVQARLNRFAL